MAHLNKSSARPMAAVLGFLFRQWLQHRQRVAATGAAMIAATLTDVFLPVYAGNLVTAVSMTGAHRAAALHAAAVAIGIMAALGLAQTVLRYAVFRNIVALTLVNMREIAGAAFWRVQRFSADWHSNTFAGSVQRKITRGMWAVDTRCCWRCCRRFPFLPVPPSCLACAGRRWAFCWRQAPRFT